MYVPVINKLKMCEVNIYTCLSNKTRNFDIAFLINDNLNKVIKETMVLIYNGLQIK